MKVSALQDLLTKFARQNGDIDVSVCIVNEDTSTTIEAVNGVYCENDAEGNPLRLVIADKDHMDFARANRLFEEQTEWDF